MPKLVYSSTKGLVQETGPAANAHPVDLGGVNRGRKARDRYYLEEYFERAPRANADIQNAAEATRMIANPNFEVVGSGTAVIALLTARPGFSITTAGGDEDSCIVTPHLDSGQSSWAATTWGTDNYTEWECAISLPALDNQKVWAGLKLTNDQLAATDADQIFFKTQSDATNGEFLDSQSATDAGTGMKWSIIYSVGGVDYTTNTDLEVTTDTLYNLKIVIDGDRKASAFINGIQYGLQTHSGTGATFGSTGVLLNDAAGVTASDSTGEQTLTVDGVDARTKFRAGDRIYKSDATLFGVVARVTSATEIVLETAQNNVADNDELYSFGQKVKANESKQKSLALTDATDFIPYIGIEAGAAAAEALHVYYTAMNRTIF